MASSSFTYVIRTNLPPEAVNRIGLEIFARWLDFALGNTVLNGRRLVHPTGRYAASIQYKQEGEATVAIIADEQSAPEATFIESGHQAVDLKTRLQHGRAYPMHRPPGANLPSGLRRTGSGPPSMKPRMWADVRSREASGYASIGPNSPPGSWIIPAMPAYAPALALAAIARSMTQGAT